jgi:hypothetical protein
MPPGCKNRVPISECEICSKLGEAETFFYKYGWDDLERPLPPEASRLERVADSEAEDSDSRHVRRCPLCGTFYHYSASYDYYVNGSEDKETLTRLTPDLAARYLTEDK